MTEPSDAPQLAAAFAALRHVAPAMTHHLQDTLLGKVWARPELPIRDRALVTLAAIIATAKDWETGVYAGKALDAGITPGEIAEMLLHLACYTGWPNAVKAALDMKPVYDARGIEAVSDNGDPLLALDPAAEAKRKSTVDGNVAPTAPALAADTNDFLFAEVWRRPGLSPRDRSLVTVAALVAIGQPEQLSFHVNRAMDNGLTAQQAGEVLSHLAYYAGWPRAMSAVGALASILEARGRS